MLLCIITYIIMYITYIIFRLFDKISMPTHNCRSKRNNVSYWKDESTVKYDIDVRTTFNTRIQC